MKKHGNSKYRPKFAKDLRNGMRKDGKSIEECCSEWGVTVRAYDNWRKAHTTFEEAHQIGEQDKTSWWRKVQRDVASGVKTGNAGVINLALKNEAGYVDKQEIEHTHEEQITTIRIEHIQPAATRIIEHERTENLLDEKPS